jgi:hypothetical protein
MKVLSVSKFSPASTLRVSKEIGFKTEDITARYPVALIACEDVVYVHVGGVTIGLPRAEFEAAQFNPDEFPKEAQCV